MLDGCQICGRCRIYGNETGIAVEGNSCWSGSCPTQLLLCLEAWLSHPPLHMVGMHSIEHDTINQLQLITRQSNSLINVNLTAGIGNPALAPVNSDDMKYSFAVGAHEVWCDGLVSLLSFL